MSRSLDEFAVNFGSVARHLSLDELAVLVELVSVELVERRVVGVARLAEVARALRERAAAERQHRAIYSGDCSQPSG
jgi:hypothetical protein